MANIIFLLIKKSCVFFITKKSAFIRPTFDFIQEILSMGETVEIVEPQMLRNEIARIGGELVKKNK